MGRRNHASAPSAYTLFVHEQKEMSTHVNVSAIAHEWVYKLDGHERCYYHDQAEPLIDRQAYESWRAPYRNAGSFVSSRTQRKYTFNNYWWRTDSGLQRIDLTKSKTGKVVSKKIRQGQVEPMDPCMRSSQGGSQSQRLRCRAEGDGSL